MDATREDLDRDFPGASGPPDQVRPNAANEGQVRGQQAKVKRDEKQYVGDLKAVMESRIGRRFMWRLLSKAGCYTMSYAPGDTHLTAFNEGRRNGGNEMMADLLLHCPNQYALMFTERTEDEKNNG